MSAIESVQSGSADDVLIDAGGDSTLCAGAGNDRLERRGGRDLLDGGGDRDDFVAEGANIDVAWRRYDSPGADEAATAWPAAPGATCCCGLHRGGHGDGGASNDVESRHQRAAGAAGMLRPQRGTA